ncbi:uncharacterized protein LOC133804540 [Humulus lupulus]|uniref:uncharacterized protein LOC133804540 n=1 Tax=Humulus lupulus TaxID=3486 RepID=UPI002B412BE4|nr:uncharacterized protein LOC133804540 [Humulus lupulus]
MMRPDNSRSSSSSCPSPSLSYPSNGGFLKNVFNMSPRLSSFFNHPLDRTSSSLARASTTISTPKSSAAELEEEITTLERQILNLERHLLSLYRAAFDGQFSTLPSTPISTCTSARAAPADVAAAAAWTSPCNQSHLTSQKATPTKRDHKVSGHRSLADHLGGSCLSAAPDRLSQDIVRCISSIYCKLVTPTPTRPQAPAMAVLSASYSSSSSTSSTLFSSRSACDSWSPRYNNHSSASDDGLKELNGGPYAAMIQVLKIRLDDDSFSFASTMLQNFRSLVKNLEKVDPRKMKREEKLAFWINIHNALVMHAHLAYGSGNRVKSASVLKAAYNVGGHCINAYVIQCSILGIRSHHSAPWLQTLFPGRKLKARGIRHEYALEYPEPLVHFALSSGDYFDPAVRAYSARTVFEDLKVAKEEFIEASVRMERQGQRETKVLAPRVLEVFGKDMSLSAEGLLEVILESVADVEKRKCISKCVYLHWLPPHNSTFRYVIHPDLAKGCH